MVLCSAAGMAAGTGFAQKTGCRAIGYGSFLLAQTAQKQAGCTWSTASIPMMH